MKNRKSTLEFHGTLSVEMYRKRSYRRRPRRATVTRRKRYTRRKSVARKRSRNLMVYNFKLNGTQMINNLPPQSTNNGAWFTPSLQNVTNIQYTSLFDEYKINKVVMKIDSFTDDMDAGIAVPQDGTPYVPYNYNYRGFIESIIDYNSPLGVPVESSTLNDYPSYKITRGTRPHVRVFTPMIQTPIWMGGTDLTGMQSQKSKWISTAYNNVPHLGCFVRLPRTQLNTSTPFWKISWTLYCSFRGIKANTIPIPSELPLAHADFDPDTAYHEEDIDIPRNPIE